MRSAVCGSTSISAAGTVRKIHCAEVRCKCTSHPPELMSESVELRFPSERHFRTCETWNRASYKTLPPKVASEKYLSRSAYEIRVYRTRQAMLDNLKDQWRPVRDKSS